MILPTRDPRFSRNYLRREIMPRLASHWPQAVAGMAAGARRICARPKTCWLNRPPYLRPPPTLGTGLAGLAGSRPGSPWSLRARLSAARQRSLLRAWLGQLTRMPDSDHWAGWESLRDAGDDADPIWRLESGELRRGAGRIWWLPADWRAAAGPFVWERPAHPLLLPGNGRLALLGEVLAGPLRVDYRRGGEVLALAGRGRRDLKRLLNEAGVPSFLRGRLPRSSEPTNCSRWPIFLARTSPREGAGDCPGARRDERPGF
ncbi:tRNA lysidine(34) synthetase TilS [Pseudomonas aeruginosa]